MAELPIGHVVDGRYEIEAVIGKGGMGCVYRARHVITQGRVALKTITDTMDADSVPRFMAEARAAATIGHPAIVAVSDANRLADGSLYLVMELLAGKPLRLLLRDLPPDQIRRVGLELLDALGAAHQRGFVHRDLKPENVFVLAGTGGVKVLDFGIAKVLGSSTTAFGHVLGTVEYMAPEQLVDSARVDGRADLWAVGVMLYEMIAGVRPYGGATREARYAALATEEPMPIGDVIEVVPEVTAFFARALARDPDHRFGSAQEMAAALRMLPLRGSHGDATTSVGGTLGTGHAQQYTPPHASLSQAPAAKKLSPLLAIGLLVVAGAITFGVVMATRKAEPGSAGSAAGPSESRTVDTSAGACTDHCARVKTCKLALSSCASDCASDPVNRECLAHAKNCDELAACYWTRRCGRPNPGKLPRTMSCADGMQCQGRQASQDTSVQCDNCFDLLTVEAATTFAQFQVCITGLQQAAMEASRAGKTFDGAGYMKEHCQATTNACTGLK